MTLRELITDRCRLARVAIGMSQSDAAAVTGLQQAAISHFETGERLPSAANLRRLALAYGVSADYLLALRPCDRDLALTQETTNGTA